MPKQTVTFTVLPNGASSTGTARFSLHLSPRLLTDTAEGRLSDFPDWVDWPATLAGMSFTLTFPALGITAPATVVSTTSSRAWRALFPTTTLVRGHRFVGHDHKRIRSYPARHVADFTRTRYGLLGARFTEEFPPFEELIGPDALGPIAFELLDNKDPSGPVTKAELARANENQFVPTSADPARWAMPFNPADLGTAAGIGRVFLQVDRFHRRRTDTITGELPDLARPKFDFHQAVALTREHTRLQRMLGLVVDLECSAAAVRNLLGGTDQTTWTSVAVSWTPTLGTATAAVVTPRVSTNLGKGVGFYPANRNDVASDLVRGMLKVGQTNRFTTIAVDADGAAIRLRQVADNVSRSRRRRDGSYVLPSLSSPDGYSLPALRSAGFSIARSGRASDMAGRMARARALNDTGFLTSGDKNPSGVIELYAEDLVRGFRWDVRDDAVGQWRSLMARVGSYVFQRDSATNQTVTDEASASTAPTTSGAPGDEDLYLQESLVRWNGWSLAAGRAGRSLTENNTMASTGGDVDGDFGFAAGYEPQAGTLPRLRFGRSYRFRARAVDIGGNSRAPSVDNIVVGDFAESPSVVHRRFEPVPAPDLALRAPIGAGESVDFVAIRSETLSSSAPAAGERHVMPPRMPIQLVEQHGMLDSRTAGSPLDTNAFAMLASRDRARIEDTAGAHPPAPGSQLWTFDTNEIPVGYLPDVLAKRALFRGLPLGEGVTTLTVPLATGNWPTARSLRIRVEGASTPGAVWNASARTLTVRLRPGDSYALRMTSQFDPADLDLMAVWPWIQEAITRWNSTHTQGQIDVAAVRTAAEAGKHWMITPPRELIVAHAVRTPLSAPDIAAMTATRTGGTGSTFVTLGSKMTASVKSSSSVDFVAQWSQPVDTGPGGADPVTPRPFESTAFTVRLDSEPGPRPAFEGVDFSGRHEFGDTRFRQVTYRAVATSRFTEHFRETQSLTMVNGAAVSVGRAVVPTTVRITNRSTGLTYAPARADETDRTTASGDFVVVSATSGTIQATTGGRLAAGTVPVAVSFVQPGIHATSAPRGLAVLSTRRPEPPKVRYVLPTFKWDRVGTTSTRRGGLRVYLERPWWSSGDGERLAVVLWPGVGTPSTRMRELVSEWGVDPVTKSAPVTTALTTASFPRASLVNATGLPLAEVAGQLVHVAAHDVAFDSARDLWYCDIEVTQSGSTQLSAYFPFIRLALARYQPNSIGGAHLSPVVNADFMQLTPQRTLSVTGSGTNRTVTLQGRAPVQTVTAVGSPNTAMVTVERRDTGMADPNLSWSPVDNRTTTMAATLANGNQVTWTATVAVPAGVPLSQLRIVVEEFETHQTGLPATRRRLVHTDIFPLG